MNNEKQYIKKISRKLCCSSSGKKEIIRQIKSDIAIAKENGKTFEEIVIQMGSPVEVAKEFNDNMSAAEKKAAKRAKIIKILSVAVLLLLLLISLIYWFFPKTYDISKSSIYTEETVTEKAKQIIRFMDEENYEAMQSEMTEQMQGLLTEEVLRNARTQLSADYGDFQSWGNTYMVEVSQMGRRAVVMEIAVSYENISVTYRMTFDEEMRLSGLYIR